MRTRTLLPRVLLLYLRVTLLTCMALVVRIPAAFPTDLPLVLWPPTMTLKLELTRRR